MAGNPSFNDLVSQTLDAYAPTIVDNAFSSKPLLWVMKNEGRIQNKDGGITCVVDLLYAESQNHGSYSGDDVFSMQDDENVTAAQYDWKQYYGLFKVKGLEEAQNSGSKTRIFDLVKTRAKALEMTIAENFDEMFFGDGSGNSGKDFIGLKAIVSASDPSWGDLGGIDSATNAWWQSTVDTTSEAWATWGFDGMTNMWLTVSEGNDHPTHMFTTAAVYASIHNTLTQDARYLDPELAQAGFQNLTWMGVPIVFDKYVDAGYFYMLNFNYITFYTLDNKWMTPTGDFEKPINQDFKVKSFLTYGQLTTSNRQRHGVHSGLTDT